MVSIRSFYVQHYTKANHLAYDAHKRNVCCNIHRLPAIPLLSSGRQPGFYILFLHDLPNNFGIHPSFHVQGFLQAGINFLELAIVERAPTDESQQETAISAFLNRSFRSQLERLYPPASVLSIPFFFVARIYRHAISTGFRELFIFG